MYRLFLFSQPSYKLLSNIHAQKCNLSCSSYWKCEVNILGPFRYFFSSITWLDIIFYITVVVVFPIKLYNNRLIFVHICQGVWWNKVYKMYYTISLKVVVSFSTYWFFSYRLYRRRLYLPSGFSRYEGQKTFLSETCLVLYMYIVYFSLICTSIFYSYYIRNLKY